MNILIPHSWLLEHLETTATPLDIQRELSLAGPSVERIYDREGEPVYDIEITTNRVDSMSVRGVAREAAVILEQSGFPSRLKPLQLSEVSALPNKSELTLPKINTNPELCKRVLCVALGNIHRTATPDWMAKRLRQIEINVHDAVIDITNYITHDLGHPCHAFDYDKLMELGGEINIVEATANLPFTTLDGAEYRTVGGEVVFTNPNGTIIDLPGIKGTANSSINDQTKNVLLWIESCLPNKIRFASMTHAIRTVAAQLNEKSVDPELADATLTKGVELFSQLCQATVASEVFDDFPGKTTATAIDVPLETLTTYLGLELPVTQVTDILQKLGCQVEATAIMLKVTPPSSRPDLTIPADIVEEVARMYGYHRLPSTIMPTAIPTSKPKEYNFHLETRLKRFLAALGWQEVYSYSMVSEDLAKESGYQLTDHLKIKNPLSDDRVYLRRSLVPSLREVIHSNPTRSELSVFELANVYEPQGESLPIEELHLALVSSSDFRTVKGQLELLLKSCFVTQLKVEPLTTTSSLYSQLGNLWVEKQVIGTLGVLQTGHVVVDLKLSQLLKVVKTHPTYQPLPKTAMILEDLTFTLRNGTSVGEMIETTTTLSPLIHQVVLKDMYQDNITLTITYHDPEQNVTRDQVEPLRRELVTTMHRQYQAQLVGQVA